MISQLISDLETIRHNLAGVRPRDPYSAVDRASLAYLAANRDVIVHFIDKLYDLSSKEREQLVQNNRDLDGSVVSPSFQKVAKHIIEVTVSHAWLGLGTIDEDFLHMTIRALRAAAVAFPSDREVVLFLSPVSLPG